MEIGEELNKMGYQFEYETGDSEDRTEVWINKAVGMAVAGMMTWSRADLTWRLR
jgi:hypothetical protein